MELDEKQTILKISKEQLLCAYIYISREINERRALIEYNYRPFVTGARDICRSVFFNAGITVFFTNVSPSDAVNSRFLSPSSSSPQLLVEGEALVGHKLSSHCKFHSNTRALHARRFRITAGPWSKRLTEAEAQSGEKEAAGVSRGW